MELRKAGSERPNFDATNRAETQAPNTLEKNIKQARGTLNGNPITEAAPQASSHSSLFSGIGNRIARWWSGNRKPTEEQRQSMVDSRLKYFEENIKPTPPPKVLPRDYRSTIIGSTFAERYIARQAARHDQQKPATVLPPPPAARKESTASQQRAAAALRRQAAASSQVSSSLGIEETKSTDTPNDLSYHLHELTGL